LTYSAAGSDQRRIGFAREVTMGRDGLQQGYRHLLIGGDGDE
jgi:hypothetical protein